MIVSLHKGHPTGTMRRCGIEFTKEKKEIDVSKEDALIIENERRLVVSKEDALIIENERRLVVSKDMTREIKQDEVKPVSTGVVAEESNETDSDPVPSSKVKIDYEEMTMSELKMMLTNADVEFGARASKSDLIKLAKKLK
jgi:hypothetical protein